MLTNKNNVLLSLGMAVAVLISLNSFRLAGKAGAAPDNSAFYAVKDSVVSAIRTFDAFSDRYLDILTVTDQNSSYRHIGETNFLRSKINKHEQDLSSFLSEWQQLSVKNWSEDSTDVFSEYLFLDSEQSEIEHETITFLERHRNVRNR